MNSIYGIDKRALTFFRRIIALIYIFKVGVLKFIFFDYYSIESGPFSNSVISVIQNQPILSSVLSTDIHLIIILSITILFGVLLFLGIFPVFSSFCALVLIIVVNRRFFPFFDGSDQVLVSILFCLIFVYLSKNSKDDKREISINSNPFILLLLVQISIIYFFNGINKTHLVWWQGEAVDITLFNVLINKPLAESISQIPFLTTFLTYATLIFEISLPILIFLTYKRNQLRIVAAFLLIVFHWGISLFVDVSFYKYYGLAFAVLLLPTSFWDFFSVKGFDTLLSFNRFKIGQKQARIITIILVFIIIFKSITSSINRQNEVFKIFDVSFVSKLSRDFQSKPLSPLQQSWIMFAPSPPLTTGYVAFEYFNSSDSTYENINFYGDDIINSKKFYHLHPVHSCLFHQFMKIEKGYISEESQFLLFNLFEYEVAKDISKNSNRKIEDYELVLFKQTYENYKTSGGYYFERIVIAAYE